ncbi:hypothetical protein MJO28_013239 [Puccinia striiformis f. sp. tritici]|uniref:Uncharacterized protein n=1 Tax=Puccinia striiformis f. sp. tritici TaxID=168172 RepID=A0ACC0DXM5_9BASI|nr:hypothetical protein MJO28_013239 [Puccinia striiformis f. sp. tritici]KAI7943015.1 hypothetical protein MJO29_012859 [Puccinia striiformis f. sp. tritici]
MCSKSFSEGSVNAELAASKLFVDLGAEVEAVWLAPAERGSFMRAGKHRKATLSDIALSASSSFLSKSSAAGLGSSI